MFNVRKRRGTQGRRILVAVQPGRSLHMHVAYLTSGQIGIFLQR